MTTWLDTICDPTAKNRPSFVAAPKTARINGTSYTVASDSKRVVFVPGDLGYDATDQQEDNLLTDFHDPAVVVATMEVAVDRLRGWAAEPVACDYQADHGKGVTCSMCRGAGSTACECDACGHRHQSACEECRGTGRGGLAVCLECTFDPVVGLQTERLGWLADDVLVNRHLFDAILPNVTDATITVTTGNQFDPIFLVGTSSGIRIVMMPTRSDTNRTVDSRFSRWPTSPPRRMGNLLV